MIKRMFYSILQQLCFNANSLLHGYRLHTGTLFCVTEPPCCSIYAVGSLYVVKMIIVASKLQRIMSREQADPHNFQIKAIMDTAKEALGI